MDESTKNVLSVQRETNKLSDKWFGLLQHFDQKQRKLDEVLRVSILGRKRRVKMSLTHL